MFKKFLLQDKKYLNNNKNTILESWNYKNISYIYINYPNYINFILNNCTKVKYI
jgi:hypothetical protein